MLINTAVATGDLSVNQDMAVSVLSRSLSLNGVILLRICMLATKSRSFTYIQGCEITVAIYGVTVHLRYD